MARQGGEGIVAAEERVAELRALVAVWKGTAEERARTKFVDGLARMVAERRNGEEGKLGLERKEERRSGEIEVGRGPAVSAGPGFLRRLRDEIYLE